MSDITATDLSLDWDTLFSEVPAEEEETVHTTHTIPDALVLSLCAFGRVDMAYILRITGADLDGVKRALRGSVYQNPEKWNGDPLLGWETAEEYLSGNLRSKLRAAREADKAHPRVFSANISAIKKVLPPSVSAKDIYITLGSPWVPCEVIRDFMVHLFCLRDRRRVELKHDEYTGTWEIPHRYRLAQRNYVVAYHTYGTMHVDAFEIIEKTLNMKTIAVYDEIEEQNRKKRVLNQNETVAALEKQSKIVTAFKEWVWRDEKRTKLLEKIFEEKYACLRRRVFDGSFLTFPGMAPDVSLYPYQKNAVARILFSSNTLLAHDVGSGKTYVLIAAGMELKRMGISRKNLYVVPNNLVAQWRNFFARIYPASRVFCVEGKNFTPAKREDTLRTVRDGEWDAVIMAYSCFDRIPMSFDFRFRELKEAKERISEIAADDSKNTTAVSRKGEQLSKAMSEMCLEAPNEEHGICFDELGFTHLFVDEAHNYKNVPTETKADHVLGISAGGSKKCKNMLEKVHFIQKQNNGGGVVMATGTPITNSLTDAFVMQKYLQSGELALLDLQTFDSWIGMFAERVTDFEVDVDTSSYRLATRFSRFHNLPELTALFASIADFHEVDEFVELPRIDGYSDSLVAKTHVFTKYLEEISQRADKVRGGRISPKEDNMLKITTDGRKAALDIRLVDGEQPFIDESKVAKCAENVFFIYRATAPRRSTQLIFCDTSTPKAAFNVYDEMKRLLVLRGIAPEEIAFVHDAKSEGQREKLFSRVRSGEIRVLLGSTFKLGMGVNVQDKLVAVHHLDVPWRPADMTQREGRILRQGNENKKVYIYRYITEGSFDAYSWQLLETKQRFISELLGGSLSDRSGSDVEGTVLSYAEVKALAIGNPLVKHRVETANELMRLFTLRRKSREAHLRLEEELQGLPAKIAHQSELVKNARQDAKYYRANRKDIEKDTHKDLRDQLALAIREQLDAPEGDRTVMEYQGFSILLPAAILHESPHLFLVRSGKYRIELGESEAGALIRIDNFLEKIGEHAQRLSTSLSELREREVAIKEELAREEDYTDKIQALEKILAALDEELGVKL